MEQELEEALEETKREKENKVRHSQEGEPRILGSAYHHVDE